MEVKKIEDGTYDVVFTAYEKEQEGWLVRAAEHNGLCTRSFTHWARPKIILFTFNFENRKDATEFVKQSLKNFKKS